MLIRQMLSSKAAKSLTDLNKMLKMWDNVPELTTIQNVDRVVQKQEGCQTNILTGMTGNDEWKNA